jgi:hypothetical protein
MLEKDLAGRAQSCHEALEQLRTYLNESSTISYNLAERFLHTSEDLPIKPSPTVFTLVGEQKVEATTKLNSVQVSEADTSTLEGTIVVERNNH